MSGTFLGVDSTDEKGEGPITVRVESAKDGPREVVLDPEAEKRLVRKCDLHVVPILWLLFLMAFLDRTNIGNARIQGMIEDLDMTGESDYNVALFIFFVPYILFEVPSNIILKRVAPSTWLSGIMLGWGVATIGQGLVKTKGGLIACRFIIGLFEAGFFPGCIYLFSFYYKRYELQWRLTLFFSASILAGGFSGLLAYAIAKMDGRHGYGGWAWIFIIEGAMTCAVAVIAKFFICDWPETAKFLNEEERALLAARLQNDLGEATMNRLDKAAAKRAFGDWKIYVGIFQYMGIVTTGYSGAFFVPTIINELGYEAQAAQVRTIPIFVVATVFALATAVLTDKFKHRYSFCMIGVVIATVGYILLLAQANLSAGVKYFALFLIVTGGFVCQPVTLVWIQNCMGGHYKRSIASAMQVGFGNCGGLIASNIFLTKEAPTYVTGYSVGLAMAWMSALCSTILFWGVTRENKKRDRGERDYRLQAPDVDNLGDDHPNFRFVR